MVKNIQSKGQHIFPPPLLLSRGGGGGEWSGREEFYKVGKGDGGRNDGRKSKRRISMPKDLPKELNSKLWNREPVTDELGLFDISYK